MTCLASNKSSVEQTSNRPSILKPLQLRCDHDDLKHYYDLTGVLVQKLWYEFNRNLECSMKDELINNNLINDVYMKLVVILTNC